MLELGKHLNLNLNKQFDSHLAALPQTQLRSSAPSAISPAFAMSHLGSLANQDMKSQNTGILNYSIHLKKQKYSKFFQSINAEPELSFKNNRTNNVSLCISS